MLDPEHKQYLYNIFQAITRLEKWRWWRSFFDGVLRGFGSIIGIILAIALLGWMLNIVGVVPAFRSEVEQWRQLLQDTQRQAPSTRGDESAK